jgi:hypothetical protein
MLRIIGPAGLIFEQFSDLEGRISPIREAVSQAKGQKRKKIVVLRRQVAIICGFRGVAQFG